MTNSAMGGQPTGGPPIAEKPIVNLVAKPQSITADGDAERKATNSALVTSILKSRFADKIPDHLKNVPPRPPAENVVMRTIHRRKSSINAAEATAAAAVVAGATADNKGADGGNRRASKESGGGAGHQKSQGVEKTNGSGAVATATDGDPRTTPPSSGPSKPLPLRVILTLSLFASTFATCVAVWSLVTTAGERNSILNGQGNAISLPYHIALFLARSLGQAEDDVRQAMFGWRNGVYSPIGASRDSGFDSQASNLASRMAAQSNGWPGLLGFTMTSDLAASTSSNAGNNGIPLGWGIRTSCLSPSTGPSTAASAFDTPSFDRIRHSGPACKSMDQWIYPRVGQMSSATSQVTIVPLDYSPSTATRFGQSVQPLSTQASTVLTWPWSSFATTSQRNLIPLSPPTSPTSGGNWSLPYVFSNSLWMGFHTHHQGGWHAIADVNLTSLLPSAMSAAITLTNRKGRVVPTTTKTYLLGTIAYGADSAKITGLLNLPPDTKTIVLAASHLSLTAPISLTATASATLGDPILALVNTAIGSKSYNLTATGIRSSLNGVWVRVSDTQGALGGSRGAPAQVNLHGLLSSPGAHIRLGGFDGAMDLTLATVVPEASFYPADVAAFSGTGLAVLMLSVLVACSLGWVAGTRAGVILDTMATRVAEYALANDFERPIPSLATANMSTLVQSGSIPKLNAIAASTAGISARSEESMLGSAPPGPSHNGLNLSTPREVWRGMWFAELHQVRRCIRELATCLAKGAWS
ncbi:hypothetical protein BCR44DRAFT_1501676 [Catenaria anguillulae PL171]|uniref:Uncharacterized protein n=1 Tax=Catenaria anguillulae PL171 TaxID=765915 RepID=A0A1Y2HIA9_9FUNG|nr:hypothetical protein BCR44DRAFT_1501676 [Catenaria anguillulae PL171]